MTHLELRDYFNRTFGLGPWPKTFDVDLETLESVETELERHAAEHGTLVRCGPNLGPLFKGVELILKR